MKTKQTNFLENHYEKQAFFGHRLTDIFLISEEIDLIDGCLCDTISLIIDSNVYWYMKGEKAVVCVLEQYAHEAVSIGKKIIIQHFSSMSAEYIDNRVISPVLDEYSIIATFNSINANGLSSWCNNIDNELIVKTNSKGYKCVLAKEPLKFISKIQAEYEKNPFRTILNFNFIKI